MVSPGLVVVVADWNVGLHRYDEREACGSTSLRKKFSPSRVPGTPPAVSAVQAPLRTNP